ncbi:CHAT domain-containing protein [Boletus edulis]|nr:CHAT domain-containing protein [Boletus edulis]
MASKSDAGEKRSRPEETTDNLAEDCSRNKRPRLELRTSQSHAPTDSIQAPGADPQCTGQEYQSKEETSAHIVITSIRATCVAFGLRRLPAGFYTVVHHSGLEWRTDNKRSSVKDDVVEWSGPIPIVPRPSDPSATVCLEVYASFEFQPMLGAGEQLRKLTITVKQLLDRGEKHIPFTLFPKDGNIISPCSSIIVTVERRNDESSDSLASGPLCSTTDTPAELEDATNHGHNALSRYRMHGERRDLERSVADFERALNNCPLNHPCRAAAQSNLATAKLILCQVADDTNASFEIPIALYRNALGARPVSHADRPSTLVQLAAVHLARFQKQRDDVEGARVEGLLHEAMGLSATDSHEKRAVAFMLQLYAGHRICPTSGQLSVDLHPSSRFTDEDPRSSSVALLKRFERYGDLADLQQAIGLLQKLVRTVSVWDYWYCAGLGNLGVALLWRFNRLGELSDLEDAISTLRDAVALTPHGHPHKPSHLNNLGDSIITRFWRLGELSDLEDAISTLRDAVVLTPHGHPHKPGFLNNLGTSFRARFQRLGELSDLEDAISTLRDAVVLTPHGHPDKSTCLNSLGLSFTARFERLGELRDLEDAISTLRDAVVFTPHGHPHKPSHLNNFGLSCRARFGRLGELNDLEDAISTLRDAVVLTPHGHPHKPGFLNNLGTSFRARFQRLGELSDLEDAISTLRDAVVLTPHGHPDKSTCLNNLGLSFTARFECLGELRDLEDAISTLRDAVVLTPHGHPHKPSGLNDLGLSFTARFERLGELSDLEDAISTLRDAVVLTPHGHPHKPGRLNNLGDSFRARFERLGELRDLEDAISTLRDAVVLTPHGHPHKPGCLNNLGNSFRARFERLGELNDLEDAISTLRDAVVLTPHGHPHKPGGLNNLGLSFKARFERLGELSDLEDAISTLRDAVVLTPHGHPDKPGCLNNLGLSFKARFERLGELSDLGDAISTLMDAADLTPHGHPGKPRCLTNLGLFFRARFERLGELNDLEDAISRHREAVVLMPHGHPDKPGHQSNLGGSLLMRFQRLGELSDLNGAISTFRDAVVLTPHGHPDKPSGLMNLGISFNTRFQRLGELSDVEDAISTLRDAVVLMPHGHPHKPSCLKTLGASFGTRFESLWELSDLEDAISTLRDAPGGLSNLGLSFRARFQCLGELSDLEDAISTLRDAPGCLNNLGHLGELRDLEDAISTLRDTPIRLNNLGLSFITRFNRLGELSDLEDAISLYSHSAPLPIGPSSVRFRASRIWILWARRICHSSLLRAYSIAINLLPQLAWIGLSLTRPADVVREAAAVALDSGFPELAVKWLEQGRSILRGSYEQLSLRELSAALDDAGATREKSLSTFLESTDDAMHHPTRTHRKLAIERDKLLQEIRRLPGFERFLLPKDFPQLLVMLNAAETRCDALILLADVDHVIHWAARLQNTLRALLGNARITRFDDRKGKLATAGGGSWESLLSTLWNGVVKPVLDALAFSTLGDLSRIFWCPTGPFVFLPIHAAGLYGTQYSSPGHKVSNFVVSSYIPTLSILAQSPSPSIAPSGDLRLLFVPQPPSDGQNHLQGVAQELKHISTVVGNSPSARTTLLESSVGTVEEVLGLMKDADWVHFACHGIQDATKPTDSGLCLANGRRLKISDIIGLSRSRGGLAFLSACQTATGDEGLSDEAIHIAAGMLFAGYGGVIGTMWSISDWHAPIAAREVYKYLFRNGTRPDYRDAARALHEAVGSLRESGEASFLTWVPFIHVGL